MSMRERYQSLALVDLKAIAKTRGIKGTSAMKKADVIEAMLALDEKEKAAEAAAPAPAAAPALEKEDKPAAEKQPEKEPETHAPAAGSAYPAGGSQAPVVAERGGSYRPQNTGYNQNRYGQGNYGQGNYGQNRSQDGRPVRRYNQNQNNETRAAQTTAPAGEENKSVSERSQTERLQTEGRTAERPQTDRPQTEVKPAERPQTEARPAAEGEAPAAVQPPVRQAPFVAFTADDKFPPELDSGIEANGILEVMPDGYGFIRSANYLPGDNDVYVAPSQIRRFGLKTGDILAGNTRVKTQNEKFSALLYVKTINGYTPDEAMKRYNFEDMTPIFPNRRIRLEQSRSSVAMRIMDLMSPVGKGQRGMIVSPPKAGKTTLLKQVAQSVKNSYPDIHLIILLIDERPEEVTDFREAIEGQNVEVIYSTFDELPEHHKRVSEMVIERAKRLVEHKKDVMILLDSITRLTRAYNLVIPPSGRTLSGGLDPAALHMPKRFFGAARNMREGGSLTILATALVDTGSKMDDVVYEEFKGTGNMEIVLDRKLSEKRVFPAIDIPKTSTRREDLLLTPDELEAVNILRKGLNSLKPDESVDRILDMFGKTRNNVEFVNLVKKTKFI